MDVLIFLWRQFSVHPQMAGLTHGGSLKFYYACPLQRSEKVDQNRESKHEIHKKKRVLKWLNYTRKFHRPYANMLKLPAKISVAHGDHQKSSNLIGGNFAIFLYMCEYNDNPFFAHLT